MANDAVWNRFISELLDKNDIVDVISSYIDVKPKGRGYWALCPFHNDRNPSLSINREGQYFHCFVCGVGGNAIRFIMKYESCSFMEAVETLAKPNNAYVAFNYRYGNFLLIGVILIFTVLGYIASYIGVNLNIFGQYQNLFIRLMDVIQRSILGGL